VGRLDAEFVGVADWEAGCRKDKIRAYKKYCIDYRYHRER